MELKSVQEQKKKYLRSILRSIKKINKSSLLLMCCDCRVRHTPRGWDLYIGRTLDEDRMNCRAFLVSDELLDHNENMIASLVIKNVCEMSYHVDLEILILISEQL